MLFFYGGYSIMSAKNVYDKLYCYIAIKIIQKVGLQIIKCPVICSFLQRRSSSSAISFFISSCILSKSSFWTHYVYVRERNLHARDVKYLHRTSSIFSWTFLFWVSRLSICCFKLSTCSCNSFQEPPSRLSDPPLVSSGQQLQTWDVSPVKIKKYV